MRVTFVNKHQLHPLPKGWAQEYSRKFKHPYWHEKHISNSFFQTKLTDWHALFIKTCNKHFFYLFSICAKERKKSIYFRLLCYQLTRKENPRNRVLRPVMQPKLFSLLKKSPLPDSLSISWIKNNIGCLKKSLFFVLDNDLEKKLASVILPGKSVFPTGAFYFPDCHWTHSIGQNLFSFTFLHSCVCFQHVDTIFYF